MSGAVCSTILAESHRATPASGFWRRRSTKLRRPRPRDEHSPSARPPRLQHLPPRRRAGSTRITLDHMRSLHKARQRRGISKKMSPPQKTFFGAAQHDPTYLESEMLTCTHRLAAELNNRQLLPTIESEHHVPQSQTCTRCLYRNPHQPPDHS